MSCSGAGELPGGELAVPAGLRTGPVECRGRQAVPEAAGAWSQVPSTGDFPQFAEQAIRGVKLQVGDKIYVTGNAAYAEVPLDKTGLEEEYAALIVRWRGSFQGNCWTLPYLLRNGSRSKRAKHRTPSRPRP